MAEKVEDIYFHKFQDVLQSGNPINVPKVNIHIKKESAVLIYTGETKGVPKDVINFHYNMVVNAQQTDVWASTQLKEMEEAKGKGGMVLVVPLAHSYGNIGMTVGILEGYKLILFPQPPKKLSTILKVAMKENATWLPGVPTLFIKLIQEPESAKYKGKLTSLIACISSASALPLEVKTEFEDITSALIVEGYDMSEASPVLTLNAFRKFKIGTVGFPLPDTMVKIVDIDEGVKILPQCPNENCGNCGPDET